MQTFAGVTNQRPGALVPDQTTLPAPYCVAGIVPSKPAWRMGWFSTCIARRLSTVSKLGSLGTAQLNGVPFNSSL